MAAKEANTSSPEMRVCPKDCTKCNSQQHAFCSAQMSFYLMEKVHGLEEKIDDITKVIEKQCEEKPPLINPLAETHNI